MSAHNIPQQLHNGGPFEVNDPGTGVPITVDRYNQHVALRIAASASETNTLADPTRAGQKLTLIAAVVGSGGSRVVTVASAYDAAGGTTLTFDAVDERVVLESVQVGAAGTADFEWRVVDFEGVTGPTANITGLQIGGTAVNATAAEINAAADVSARIVNVTDAATYTVLAANSGRPHIMPNFTSSCTLALPTASAGLEFEFFGKAVAVDAQNWVFDTGSATNFYLGSLVFLDTDDPADTVTTGVFPNGTSNDILTVVTPAGGTRIKLICDGTNWIAGGIVISATTPAFSDT
jgi:hypothetical protein